MDFTAMKIIIIGLGTICKTVLKSLSGKGHTITIPTGNFVINEKGCVASLVFLVEVLA